MVCAARQLQSASGWAGQGSPLERSIGQSLLICMNAMTQSYSQRAGKVGEDSCRELPMLSDRELFAKLAEWEAGLLSQSETERLFQAIVSRGLLFCCPGAVRRTAALLIRDNRIHA
jgi:hypothetical protein